MRTLYLLPIRLVFSPWMLLVVLLVMGSWPRVVKSLFQTAAHAGYPAISFMVDRRVNAAE